MDFNKLAIITSVLLLTACGGGNNEDKTAPINEPLNKLYQGVWNFYDLAYVTIGSNSLTTLYLMKKINAMKPVCFKSTIAPATR